MLVRVDVDLVCYCAIFATPSGAHLSPADLKSQSRASASARSLFPLFRRPEGFRGRTAERPTGSGTKSAAGLLIKLLPVAGSY